MTVHKPQGEEIEAFNQTLSGENNLDLSVYYFDSSNPDYANIPGNYTVKLTITDTKGLTNDNINIVTVEKPIQPYLSVSPKNINIQSEGGNAMVTVSSNIDWEINNNESWLNIDKTNGKDNGTFNISVLTNSSVERIGIVTVNGGQITQEIEIKQVGSQTSNKPVITSQPSDITVSLGESASFCVTVESISPITYQWYKNGVLMQDNQSISGSKTRCLQIESVLGYHAGSYTCYIENEIGGVDSEAGALTIMTTNLTELPLNQHLTIFASSITDFDNSGDVFKAEGNVRLNDILYFSGILKVDKRNLEISGNGQIYLKEIARIDGNLELYNGAFSFAINEKTITDQLFKEANNVFTLAEIPLYIKGLTLLHDGVRIDGKLKFPKIMGSCEVEINTLQISRSEGIGLEGAISLNNIGISDNTFKLKKLTLNFNSIENNFSGVGEIETSLFDLGANADIIGGRLDAIGVSVSTQNPVIIPGTGFSISEAHGGVNGIASPPLVLQLGAEVVPTIQGSFDIVKLKELDLKYTWNKEIEGSGKLSLFDKNLAAANIKIGNDYITIEGDANLYDFIIGRLKAKITWHYNQIDVSGVSEVILVIPDREGFPFGLIEGYLSLRGNSLPYPLAETSVYLRNKTVAGNFRVFRSPEFNFILEFNGSGFDLDYSRGYEDWDKKLFWDLKSQSVYSYSSEEVNPIEGHSVRMVEYSDNLKSLQSQNNACDIEFVLEQVSSKMIIRVHDNMNIPIYNVKMPNGKVVSPNNFAEYSNIDYIENSSKKNTYYTFVDPLLGKWEISVLNCTENTLLDIFGKSSIASIMINSIDIMNDSIAKISWVDSYPDGDAKISLYYDTDRDHADGILIKDSISEDDLVDHYLWNYSKLNDGVYYIYAVMYDNNGIPVISYSQQPLTIRRATAPNAPFSLRTEKSDTSIILHWESANNEEMNHIIYYSDDMNTLYSGASSFAVGTKTSYDFGSLIPGRTYYFSVSAKDSLGNESDYSNIAQAEFVTTLINNQPVILNQEIISYTHVDSIYSYQLLCYDADGDSINYDIKAEGIDISINNYGLITWTPKKEDIGFHQITVFIDDQLGGKDSITYNLTVYNAKPEPIISLNKNQYTCFGEYGFITLRDIRENISPIKMDSVMLLLFTNAEPDGELVYATETGSNTNTYSAAFEITKEGNSSSNKLQANENDTIIVRYINDQYEQYEIKALFKNDPFEVQIGNSIIGTDRFLVVPPIYSSYLWTDGITKTSALKVTEPGDYAVYVSDVNGCVVLSNTITIGIPSWIDNNKIHTEPNLIIYPNPVSEQIKINYNVFEKEVVTFIVYDINGKIILKKAETELIIGNNETNIDMSGYRNGIYFIHFQIGKFNGLRKIIVSR